VKVTKVKELKKKAVAIKPPNLKAIRFMLIGTAPLVQRPIVTARYKSDAEVYRSAEGWRGIPSNGLLQSAIGAMQLQGLKIRTVAGMFAVVPDGFDTLEGTALTRITRGVPRDSLEAGEKLGGGLFYDEGWEAKALIRFDADTFTPAEVVEIMRRAGEDVGVGLLRPDAHRFRKGEPDYSFGTFDAVPA